MSNLFAMPLLLALVAFAAGWLAAKFSVYVGTRATQLEAPKHESEIRALEASLRVARKEAEDKAELLTDSTQQLEALRASLDDMEQTSQFQQAELNQAYQNVKLESAKVVDLRRELTDRAEAIIRAQVEARDSSNELSLLKAGIVLDEDAEDADDEAEVTESEGSGWGNSRRRGDGISDC